MTVEEFRAASATPISTSRAWLARRARRLLPATREWINEAKHDTCEPWFLQDGPRLNRRDSVLVYGAFRRSCSMLHVPFRVVRRWWQGPHAPETPTNGSVMLSSVFLGAFKPVGWIFSVVIAAIVGLDFGRLHSNSSFASHLSLVVSIAWWVLIAGLVIQSWRFLRRLQRVLNQWVTSCSEMSPIERRTEDMELFGYSLGDEFRRRFHVRGVNVLALVTLGAVFFWFYGLGHP